MGFSLSFPRLLIQCNFASVITCIFFSTFILTNVSFTKKVNAVFLTICFSILFLTASDNIRFITYHMSEPDIWRYLSAAGGYTLRPFIICLFLPLTGQRSKARLTIWLMIPLILNTVIAFLSWLPPFRGLMFDFDAQNVFIRGPFGWLPYFCCIFYLLVNLYFIFRKTVIIHTEILILIVILVLGGIATAMESIMAFDLLLAQVYMIGTVFYYLFLNVQIYKRDTLTQLENRRCFHLALERSKKKKFSIVSMDLNDLKLYNDNHGHAAGDEALVACTEIMIKSFPRKCKLYRTGGDEFMAVLKGYSYAQALDAVGKFQYNMEKTPYRVACGIAQYNPGDNLEEILTLSDQAMYKNKQQLKQK